MLKKHPDYHRFELLREQQADQLCATCRLVSEPDESDGDVLFVLENA